MNAMAVGDQPVSLARKVVRVLLLCAALALFLGGLVFLKRTGMFEKALEWIASLGPWKPVIFMIIYMTAVVLMVPASVFTLGAGILFGIVVGEIYVLIGAWISGTICFLIARHFARDWVARRLKAHPKFQAVDEAVAREGWKIVALVRLAPVFPYSITSYGFGLTRVPLWQYVLANIAIIPGSLWYVYLGTLIGDVAGVSQGPPMALWLKLTIGATAFIVIFYLTRFVRRALQQKTGEK